MASTAALAARAERGFAVVRETVEQHGTEERRHELATYFTTTPNPARDPWAHAAYQAVLMATLAEIIQHQAERIAVLENGTSE